MRISLLGSGGPPIPHSTTSRDSCRLDWKLFFQTFWGKQLMLWVQLTVPWLHCSHQWPGTFPVGAAEQCWSNWQLVYWRFQRGDDVSSWHCGSSGNTFGWSCSIFHPIIWFTIYLILLPPKNEWNYYRNVRDVTKAQFFRAYTYPYGATVLSMTYEVLSYKILCTWSKTTLKFPLPLPL